MDGTFMGYTIEEVLMGSYILNAVLLLALIGIYFLAGDMVKVWIWAWYKKRPISLQWTKHKTWKFQVPNIDPGIDEIWELDKGRRAIEVRRNAVGIAPHKIQMMLSTTDFPAGISPKEVEGP